MTWTIKIDSKAAKFLKSLDKTAKQRIEQAIDQLAASDNPRNTGKALQGSLSGLWRYRIGDYRLLCRILDGALIILVVEIGHRKQIYR